jgi:hypothetical protein
MAGEFLDLFREAGMADLTGPASIKMEGKCGKLSEIIIFFW